MSAVVGGTLTTAGVLLILITAVGLLRFPDVFSRMHAASKTTSLGLGFTFAGVAVLHGTAATSVKLALAVVFMLLTQPIAVHLLGRAAHIGGVPTWEGNRWDELRSGPADGEEPLPEPHDTPE